VKWKEVRDTMKKKLDATLETSTKHNFWYVALDGKLIGKVKDSHGPGEVKSHEIGGCADSLGLNEYDFKRLVACPMSREEFFERHRSKPPA
jgi:hypothetical protein